MNNKTVSETEERNKEESSFQFLFSTRPESPLTSCMYTDLLALSTYHAYNRFMSWLAYLSSVIAVLNTHRLLDIQCAYTCASWGRLGIEYT